MREHSRPHKRSWRDDDALVQLGGEPADWKPMQNVGGQRGDAMNTMTINGSR